MMSAIIRNKCKIMIANLINVEVALILSAPQQMRHDVLGGVGSVGLPDTCVRDGDFVTSTRIAALAESTQN